MYPLIEHVDVGVTLWICSSEALSLNLGLLPAILKFFVFFLGPLEANAKIVYYIYLFICGLFNDVVCSSDYKLVQMIG
jgi:hypothetical protein